MRTSRKLSHALFSLFALILMSAAALAADPGAPYPPESEVSDQKAGSVLIYNYYTSGTNTQVENTRINITNTSSTHAAFVHIYFVAAGCAVADAFICLTANQTASFLTSDLDPQTSGYIVAIAVDPELGCPISFNFLIGDLYVKAPPAATGGGAFAANLAAEAFSALYEFRTKLPGCDQQSILANLPFNGLPGGYNRVPFVLALDNIPSNADGNTTKVIVNRIGGSLATTASAIGRLFGLLFDDAENLFSFTQGVSACQWNANLGGTTPRTTPRFDSIIPSQRTGWMKLWSTDLDGSGRFTTGILGAMIVATNNPNGFSGGHNLHKLTLHPGVVNTVVGNIVFASIVYQVPVFPPSC